LCPVIAIIAKDATPAKYAFVAKLLLAVCEETNSCLGSVIVFFLPPTVLVMEIGIFIPAILHTSFM